MANFVHSLSRDEQFAYNRCSEEILGETLAAFAGLNTSRLDPTEWKFLARRGQISVHRAVSSSIRQGVDSCKRRVIASGFLTTSLHDVLEGLYVEDDGELLTTQAILYPNGYTVTGAAVLIIAEPRQLRASSFQFAGVKWYSWKKKPNNKSVNLESQEYDFLTYERMGMALLVDNGDKKDGSQEVAYHVILSMNKPEWPLDVARGSGLRKADMAFCFLFRKVCEDLVECFALVNYECRTSTLSRRGTDIEIADRVLMVLRLPDCARAKMLSEFVQKAKGRPMVMSTMCLRCASRRRELRNCCICKKSVCQKCFELKPIFSLNARTHKPETETFCSKCLARIMMLIERRNAQRIYVSGISSDEESLSTASTESRKFLKFWRKSEDRKKGTESTTYERETTAQLTDDSEPRAGAHTQNYDGLFQNYNVCGRARENPKRRNLHQQEMELAEKPKKEQENVGPLRENHARQNPEAVAAQAVAASKLMSMPRRKAASSVTREKQLMIAEIYSEDIYAQNGDKLRHSDAERSHLLYLERRQFLNELDGQRRFCCSETLPVQEMETISKTAPKFRDNNLQASQRTSQVRVSACFVPDEQVKIGPKSAPTRKFATSSFRRSMSTRDYSDKTRQKESEETFRMDLYGQF